MGRERAEVKKTFNSSYGGNLEEGFGGSATSYERAWWIGYNQDGSVYLEDDVIHGPTTTTQGTPTTETAPGGETEPNETSNSDNQDLSPTALDDGSNEENTSTTPTDGNEADGSPAVTSDVDLVTKLQQLLPTSINRRVNSCAATRDQIWEALLALPQDNGIVESFRPIRYRFNYSKTPVRLGYLRVHVGATTGHAAVEVTLVDGTIVLADNGGLSGDPNQTVTSPENVPAYFVPHDGPPLPYVVDAPWFQSIADLVEQISIPSLPWWGPHGKL